MTLDQQATLALDTADKPAVRTGPGRPTQKQIKERNRELLDKALDLFLEKGFERTTIDAITAAVGMAKRTVYGRYGDKMSLFKAALERAIDEWIIPVDRLQAQETEDLEESLVRIGRILTTNVLSPAGMRLLRITNTESYRMPEIGMYTMQKGTERTLVYLADLFRRRIGPGGGEMPDPDEAALAFLHLVVGGPASLAISGVPQDEDTIERHTHYCVRLFLRGLLPR